ncbi:MAG: hypothetical protein NZM27_02585 [Acetobacteraceae bacterium]|nr:hypothetical protein [Acetobacteraceae bacterium]MDW8398819.1 hypothetical protein [Acetobacteraceae bacterium]
MVAERDQAAAATIAVEVRHLVLEFPAAGRSQGRGVVRALDHVSLDVGAGKFLGLVGLSATRKTTLGKTILGSNGREAAASSIAVAA